MTLPNERTRAVISTREFLVRLTSPYNGGIKGVKREVREEARRLLRHYPLPWDIHAAATGDGSAFDEGETLRWMDALGGTLKKPT